MPRIRIIRNVGGRPGYRIGEVVELGDLSCKCLIASGHAELVQQIETAALAPSPVTREVESAVKPNASSDSTTKHRAGKHSRTKRSTKNPPK